MKAQVQNNVGRMGASSLSNSGSIKGKADTFIKIYDEYEGVTDVIPTTDVQVLETKKKVVKTDITVREIPFESVSNLSGGYTATIGGY